jgi:PPOX class probable F420-dependent enzyme
MPARDTQQGEQIPRAFHDFFERKTFAHVATLFPSGAPHVTPVWVDYEEDDNRLLVNTERHRQKAQNTAENPAIAVSMTDPEDPYRYLSVTGEVEEQTTEGAREHIETMAQRYVGGEYPSEIKTERVILRIRPDRVFTSG